MPLCCLCFLSLFPFERLCHLLITFICIFQLRMMQRELSVDEVVKNRSFKVSTVNAQKF